MKKTNKDSIDETVEILLDAFVESLDKNSKEQYRQVTNALEEKNMFHTEAEKHFLPLVIKLIASGRTDHCMKLNDLVRFSVCVHDWDERSTYKSYCVKFTDYLEKFLKSASRSNEKIKDRIRRQSAKYLPITDTEEKWLEEALAKHNVFPHKKLMEKFRSRLRRQDRLSGDKVWLPLNYIAQLYSMDGKTSVFTEWLNSLAEGIFVHYMDEKKKIKSVQFKSEQVFLALERNEDGAYDVYVVLARKHACYRAYTPTGNGNTKEKMTVKDISNIAIDHVKPIDQTLRDLYQKGKIPNLEKVSKSFQKMKKLSDKGIEEELLEELYNELKADKDRKGNDGIYHLTVELNRIKNDGVLRLMNSDYNGKKGNSSTYDRIIKNEEGYFGLLGEAFLGEESKEIYLYQHLNEPNAPTRASFGKKEGTEVKISKKIIDYI